MKVCFMRPRGFDAVTLDDLPDNWPVPRVGEAVMFTQPKTLAQVALAECSSGERVWLVLDVLYTYQPNVRSPIIVIKLHPEA